ncbi:putative chromatin remodeling & transcriptional activation HMG family [Helianthus anomalus]
MKFVEKTRARKDPNKPKRPGSAFFVFIMECREKFKEENPDYKYVAAVSDLFLIFFIVSSIVVNSERRA